MQVLAGFNVLCKKLFPDVQVMFIYLHVDLSDRLWKKRISAGYG